MSDRMFEYYVFAPCERSVGEELNRYLPELSPKQMRHRRRESFATLKTKLATLALQVDITEHPEQAAVTVLSGRNILSQLREMELHVIDYGKTKKFPIGTLHLFYVRATFSTSPDKNESGAKILEETQTRIKEILATEFDAEPGLYPFTYFVPEDPHARWLPSPQERRDAGITQLGNIGKALARKKICAELGMMSSRA